MKIRKSKPKISIASFLKHYFDENQLWKLANDEIELLVQLVSIIRPKKPKAVQVVDIQKLLEFLQKNDFIRLQFSYYVKELLHNKKFNKFLSDAGILRDVDFIFEVRKRIFSKLLPYQPNKDSLEYILNQVFYLPTDTIWVNKIPILQIEELHDLLLFKPIYDTVEEKSVLSEMLLSMSIITQRISGRAMETDVIKMVPEYDNLESPFAAFEKELHQIDDTIRNGESNHFITSSDLYYKQLLILHKQCNDFVEKAFANSSKYGISLRVNQNLLRIRQQLYRLKVLIPLLVVDREENKKNNGIQLALKLIRYNCYKNDIRDLVNESTQLLSYEVTQHTAKTGEKYITETRQEYFKMFRAALGGGLIVGILCIIKVMLGKVETSGFGHAFLYSMNYSIGFIAIYLCGFTLATKQPAMTASALIRALEQGMKKQGNSSEKHQAFAVFFARVFRSQFIAFVGNVIMAFPVALLGIWLIDYAFEYNIAASKWTKLLTDISPVHSPAIFHAAIAGVFLFLSGIISGSIANRDKHHQVYYRIQEHPVLKMTFGRQKTKKLADIYEKKWAGIISNFWFGVFMGSTASIGLFFGLNLDIRHITFVSGNLALGLYGADFMVALSLVTWCVIGIGVIGLVNFLVSFALSLGLAFRSRNIPLREIRFVISSIWKHFKKKPMSFFFPSESKIKTQVEEEYLTSDTKK
ncbi:site-specific recombinase [Flavobacterium microcysteis]|uniref:Recombinase n=1 Tax=Flavobacterium microcysteis TaxID=2596891 RepID=A0A501QMI6_9FLAO|nr:recombinase [Flavobacterium microcysteis]TPD73678.1 recombinase [Flavobacterium microcysteis]